MLDDLNDLLEALGPLLMPEFIEGELRHPIETEDGDMFCPPCQQPRRMKITARVKSGIAARLYEFKYPQQRTSIENIGMFTTTTSHVQSRDKNVLDLYGAEPSLFWLQCVQCKSHYSALIYKGPKGASLAIFPEEHGGLSSLHTPKNVAYYLDEAYKAQCGGAVTAAILMYRAALEQLLTEQGFTTNNCANKIKDLEARIAAGTAPGWTRDFDTQFFKVIKDLGNDSIHVNSGDTDDLAALDSALLADIHTVFTTLLDEVYERPARKAQKLKALQSKQSQTSKPATPSP